MNQFYKLRYCSGVMVAAAVMSLMIGCGDSDDGPSEPDGSVIGDAAKDTRDAMNVDVASDTSLTDRTEPDTTPDTAPDSEPDSDPDSESDSDPDSEPDSEPDVEPDVVVVDKIGRLVVDSNRNGKLEPEDPDEMANKNVWGPNYGAVFLANVDDDNRDRRKDYVDSVVNGPEDAKDLARFAIVGSAEVPANFKGKLSIDDTSHTNVRIFRVDGDTFTEQTNARDITLSHEDLVNGVEFAIEGKTFVMSKAADAWTGSVSFKHEVIDGDTVVTTDEAVMRVAPLLFMHNLMGTEKVWVAPYDTDFVRNLRTALNKASVPLETLRFTGTTEPDQWTQDLFEMAYTSMPAEGGPHTIHVAFRTPTPDRKTADGAIRTLLGQDFGTVHVVSRHYNEYNASLDSTGNWDAVPPYEKKTGAKERYPYGRVLIGSTARVFPDRAAVAFMEAQEVQPILKLDTSWLMVGHVDEFLSFVKADTARGWRLLFARPALAVEMFRKLQANGHGNKVIHEGKLWDDSPPVPADITVNEVLADADLMAANQEDQATLDGILVKLVDELELAEDEITYMPFLEESITYGGFTGSVAYQPGTVNLLHVDGHLVIADPFGPKVSRVDYFQKDLNDRLGPLGLTTHYVDDWDLYHRLMGEVHCGTNVLRKVSDRDAAWWKDGR